MATDPNLYSDSDAEEPLFFQRREDVRTDYGKRTPEEVRHDVIVLASIAKRLDAEVLRQKRSNDGLDLELQRQKKGNGERDLELQSQKDKNERLERRIGFVKLQNWILLGVIAVLSVILEPLVQRLWHVAFAAGGKP